MSGYDERTLINNHRMEVYGQDGFGWYTYSNDAAEIVGKSEGVVLRPSTNALFTYLDGMTEAKLKRKGFFNVT